MCGGAGAAGYWKLNGEWKATVNHLEVERRLFQEQRNEAVAARSKAEQELKVKLADMEAKLAAAASRVNAAEAAGAAAEAKPRGLGLSAGGPLPGNRGNRFAARRLRGGGGQRALPGPAAKPINPTVKLAPPGGPEPKVAKKKNMTDDPLGGLRL
jgi:hypothetical protein